MSNQSIREASIIRLLVRRWGVAELVSSDKSMLPFIYPNDVCIFHRVDSPNDLALGDVVLYEDRSGALVGQRCVHYVKLDQTAYYLLKSDCGDRSGEAVEFERIVGKLTAIRRGGKTVRVHTWPYRWWSKMVVKYPEVARKFLFLW